MGIDTQIELNQQVDSSFNVKFLFDTFKEKLAFYRNRLWPSYNSTDETMEAYTPLLNGEGRNAMFIPDGPPDRTGLAATASAEVIATGEYGRITSYAAGINAQATVAETGASVFWQSKETTNGEPMDPPMPSVIFAGPITVGAVTQSVVFGVQKFKLASKENA